jgi:hypothetical protein
MMNNYEIGILLFEIQQEIKKQKDKEIDYLQKESKLIESKSVDFVKGATETNYKNKIEEYSKGIEDSLSIIEQKRRELFSKELKRKEGNQ